MAKGTKENKFCGKDLRKYLYTTIIAGVFIVIGSYWYVEYYSKGHGFVISTHGQPAQTAPLSQQNANIRPAAFTAQPLTVAASPFTTVAAAMQRSVVNISATQSNATSRIAIQNQAQPGQGAGQGMQFANPFSGVATESIGSGIIITDDGYILTNYHVVEKAAQVHVTVFNSQGSKRYHAQVIRLAETLDLALLKITPEGRLVPAALGNSGNLNVGDQVLAFGSPFGLDQTVSQGIVSGMRKSIAIEGVTHRDLIQTDAAINQGNSGGPLVDLDGYVIGVNTAIYTPNGAFAGVGFSVPSNTARGFVEEAITLPNITPALKTGAFANNGAGNAMMMQAAATVPPIQAGAPCPHPDRGPCVDCHTTLPGLTGGMNRFAVGPGGAIGMNAAMAAPGGAANNFNKVWLGAEVQPLNRLIARNIKPQVANGAFVNSVYPGSPADAGGLLAGDVIFKLDGRWVRSADDLFSKVADYQAGDNVRASIVRNGDKQNIYISLSKTPGDAAPALAPPAGVTPRTPQANTPPPIPNEFEWLGMELQPITQGQRARNIALKGKRGALVSEVSPGSQASMAGIRTNDIILTVNRRPVDEARSLNDVINATNAQAGVFIVLDRAGRQLFTTVR